MKEKGLSQEYGDRSSRWGAIFWLHVAWEDKHCQEVCGEVKGLWCKPGQVECVIETIIFNTFKIIPEKNIL